MTTESCPELDVLFDDLAEGKGPALEHARGCEACSVFLEDHRQLEKDLFRLADPLPPADFVHQVMAKVAQAPAPVRSELKVGLSILAGTLLLAAAAFVLANGANPSITNLGGVGVTLASFVMSVRSFVIALGSGLGVVWKTAAVPMATTLSLLLLFSLLTLKRLAGANALNQMKVTP